MAVKLYSNYLTYHCFKLVSSFANSGIWFHISAIFNMCTYGKEPVTQEDERNCLHRRHGHQYRGQYFRLQPSLRKDNRNSVALVRKRTMTTERLPLGEG
jgi:hypothetical protein